MRKLEHVGIIMDGNRRWAKERGLTTFEGHLAGAMRIEPVVQEAAKEDIGHLSLYAFSTENWNRPDEEKSNIINVFRQMLKDPVVDRFKEQGVRVKVLGDYEKFPSDIVENIEALQEESKTNERIIVNFALGYGGRDEIVRATNKAITAGHTEMTEEIIANFLDTAGQPDVDLLIRTGGEHRTSNFLPWQTVYAEQYYVDPLWPDFGPEDFDNALNWYKNVDRRFGK